MKASTIEKVDSVIEAHSDGLMNMIKSDTSYLDDINNGINALARLVTATARASIATSLIESIKHLNDNLFDDFE